jgi:signal transduction histidine kinase
MLARSKGIRYLLPVATVAAALGLRLALRNPQGGLESPFLLFLAAVMASAAFGGVGPGMVAVGLAALAVSYFLLPPLYEFSLPEPRERWEVGLFLVEGTFVSILSGMLHAARHRAEERRAALAREVERRAVLEREVLEAGDRERERVGHDLHDGLGQHLTGVALMSHVLAQRLQTQASPQAGEAQRISEMVNEATLRTRDLARGLSPVRLPAEGLAAALRALAGGARELFDVECEFAGDDAADVRDLGAATHLYRIAQEALTNSVRHGRARHVRIELRRRDGGTLLSVADDGVGIGKSPGTAGMGLKIMEYRAHMIGASLEIGPGPAGGTYVACKLPVGAGDNGRNGAGA